ncbi:MAG: hypothetical protein HQ509_03130 [Candidatus Marinimicrobia bacterium]|nr:hypothetical protein [Candidatus Neomarinimicrobiota bacterium]
MIVFCMAFGQKSFLHEKQFQKVVEFYLEDHNPEYKVMGVSTYNEREEYILRIDMNDSASDTLEPSSVFESLAIVSQFSEILINGFVVIFHDSNGQSNPAIYTAEVACSNDCFLTKTMSLSDWKGTCLISRMNPQANLNNR